MVGERSGIQHLLGWLCCLVLLVVPGWGQVPETGGVILGVVTSAEGPLVGVQVWVEETELGDVTDEGGRYRLEPLGAGIYSVVFSHIGYRQEIRALEVQAGREYSLDIQLTLAVLEMEGLLVSPKEDHFDPGGVTARLTARMIREAPGAAQDIFLVLQTLPGIASGGDDSKLYVRGGRPDENLVIYDGATISSPFHFDFIGGGFYSIFNSSQVEKVEFYSGGFPARYGDRLSAVMVIENREGSREARGIELSLSMADIKGLVETPLPASATTLLSFRRSYFDLLLGKSGFGGEYDLLPFFYDLNSKTDVFFSDRQRLSINLLYSQERMSGEFDEPHWIGNHSWFSESWTTGLRLRSLISPSLVSDLNLYWSEGYKRARHADGVGIENTRQGEIALKEDLTYYRGSHEFHLGAWLVEDRGEMDIQLPLDLAYNFEEIYFDSRGKAAKMALYVEDTWEGTGWLAVNYGLRSDYVVPSSETILTPRLNVVLTPSERFQITARYGGYSQSPPGYELKANPTQRSRRARSWGLGLIGLTPGDIHWSLEAYWKRLSRLMTIDSTGSFADGGRGSVGGLEVYLQKKAGDRFIGWLAFTYSVAKRKEGRAREVARFDYDQTYLVTAVGQYRPTVHWNLSFRFRYATGRPYTPAEGGWFDPEVQRYFPLVGARNSNRYSPYHRLDFRLSRHLPELLGGMTVYVETINTYNRDNVAYYIWSEDFSATRNFTIFPFIPILGIDLRI